MTLTVIGIALGLGGAYVLTKYLESLTSMLFGVEARDPWTFACDRRAACGGCVGCVFGSGAAGDKSRSTDCASIRMKPTLEGTLAN